jgi:hypothetical protein
MKRGIVDAVQLRRTSKIEEVLVYDRHDKLQVYIIAGREWKNNRRKDLVLTSRYISRNLLLTPISSRSPPSYRIVLMP